MPSAKKKVLIIAFLYYHKIFIHEQLIFSLIWRPLQPGALGGCLGHLCQEPALPPPSYIYYYFKLFVSKEQIDKQMIAHFRPVNGPCSLYTC